MFLDKKLNKTNCKMRINRVTPNKGYFCRASSNTTLGNQNSENNETHACYISEDKKCVSCLFNHFYKLLILDVSFR